MSSRSEVITVADRGQSDEQSMCETLPNSSSLSHKAAVSTDKIDGVPESEATHSVDVQEKEKANVTEDVPRDFFVIPVPKYLRHNPDEPARFGILINVIFAVATTFSACSISYRFFLFAWEILD